MEVEPVRIKRYSCRRCGHHWDFEEIMPFPDVPDRCPSCASFSFDNATVYPK